MKLIDNATRASVRELVDYLHDDEKKHYEETDPMSTKRQEHIFEKIMRVDKWLDETEKLMGAPNIRITPFDSPRSSKPVANQWVIRTDDGEFFQSYQSIIAFQPYGGGKTVLDSRYWDYSTTTGKYRNEFLGEDKRETERKIKSGEYILADLNGK